ncbi:MAG TPA: DUF6515 family protein [Mucilaginibacter sp.]|nr:DUF6515 family protein [Mucilaginibacter sp.]
MKAIYKRLLNTALGALVCVSLAVPASAQHRPSTGGGGGGGNRGGGGGGGVSSRPSVSPAPTFNRAPQQSNVGVARPSIAPRPSGQQSFARPSQSQRPSISTRPNYNYGRPATGDRSNYGYTPRTYGTTHRPATSGGYVYRSSPRIGYGHGGYWGNHNYYHYYHGYYGTYYLPRIGFSIGVLPYGYYPFYYGDYQYYYSDGLFYQYDNNEYTVVEPPIGAEVKELPEKAQSIVINGQQYYELNGVYYQPVTKDDGSLVYQVAGKDGELNTAPGDEYQDVPQGPMLGDIVPQLPPDCRQIKIDGEKLFVSPDGVYFKEITDDDGNKTYKVVGLPSDEGTDQN